MDDLSNHVAYLTFSCCSFTYFDQCYLIFWGRKMRLHSSRNWVGFFENYTHSLPHSPLWCLFPSHCNLPFVLVILQWIVQIAPLTTTLFSLLGGWPLWAVSHVFLWVCPCGELAQKSGEKASASPKWQKCGSGYLPLLKVIVPDLQLPILSPFISLECKSRNSLPQLLNLGQSPTLDSFILPHFSK